MLKWYFKRGMNTRKVVFHTTIFHNWEAKVGVYLTFIELNELLVIFGENAKNEVDFDLLLQNSGSYFFKNIKIRFPLPSIKLQVTFIKINFHKK